MSSLRTSGFLLPVALVILSIPKPTVLLQGWHSPMVTMLPIWMSLGGVGGRCMGMFFWCFSE